MQQFENIVILAAGSGNRFWPLRNKALFPFFGIPLLVHRTKKLRSYSKQIVVVTKGEDVEKIKKVTSKLRRVKIIAQTGEGFASAYLSAAKHISGEALLVNVVDIFDEKQLLPKILKEREGNKLILTAKKIKKYFPGGYLKLDKGKVTEIVEKPLETKRPSDMVRLVADYFADFSEFAKLLSEVESVEEDGSVEEALNKYMTSVSTTHIEYEDFFGALKQPWDVLDIMDHYLSGIKSKVKKGVYINKTAIIEGSVHFEEGVRVHEYAKVVGPAYIGKDTVIGNYALVLKSMIGTKCIVGGYTELTRSYLGDKVFLHRNYVGDSVVSDNVAMGAGTVTANWRFDEKGISSTVGDSLINTNRTKLGAIIGARVKIGVNASTMPGVKLASGSVVHPHEVVKRDIDGNH